MSKAIMERHVAEIRIALIGLDGKSGLVADVTEMKAEQAVQNLAIQAAQSTGDEAKDAAAASTRRVAATDRRMWTGLGVMLLAAAGVIADFTLRR